MGSPVNDKNGQVAFLKQRLNMFLDLLDSIEPASTDVDDVDRLIKIVDEMESKCREFKHRDL